MIELLNISKTFKQTIHAVQDVSLSINDGEIFGIIGYSGAGKSTLVRLINLLERPTSGSVTFNGKDQMLLSPKELRLTRKKMGMIFQHFNLMHSRTVAQNVAFPLKRSGLTKTEIKEKVTHLLELVGLSDKAAAYPSNLSGGQKQRVAIARALANDPSVLLCDEATSALDPQTTLSILELLKQLNQTLGLTIVLITHEMNVVKTICDRVAVMKEGRVVEMGDVVDLFAHPKHEMSQSFIQMTSSIDQLIETLDHQTFIDLNNQDYLVKVAYTGVSTTKPLLSTLTTDYGITTNILFGNIELIKQVPIGKMLVVLSGERIDEALTFLREHDVEVEVMKHGLSN